MIEGLVLSSDPYKLRSLIESGLVNRGDGTIFDTKTNLLWQQEPPDTRFTWKEAHKYCKNLRLAGHNNWRLPTIEELKTLINARYIPTIDPIFECISWWYWSSSIFHTLAWRISFNDGSISVGCKDVDVCIRAVCG